MAAHYSGVEAATSGCPKALLLRAEVVLPEDDKLAALLDVLGVSWQAVQAGEFTSRSDTNSGERFCVISPASCMTALLADAMNAGGDLPQWMTRAESVYIYGFTEDSEPQRLLRFLTGDPCAKVC